MKKLILGAFAVTVAVGVFAQGQVALVGNSASGTQHIWGPSINAPTLSLVGSGSNDHNPTPGTTPYAASGMSLIGSSGLFGPGGAATTLAQLLAAPGANAPDNLLVPSGQTTTFRTGRPAGLTFILTDVLENVPIDAPAVTLEVVAWDNSSGQYPTWATASAAWEAGLIDAGMSGSFTVNDVGGFLNTPPVFAYNSFNLYYVPEPSTFALAGLGAAAVLTFRRRKPGA
jgi:hypothetical protein